MHPPHSRDLLNPDDGNYSVQEEVFAIGLQNEDPALRAYRHHRQDDPTYNVSFDSDIGWGHGVWSTQDNVQRPPPHAPSNSHRRQDMDLNESAAEFSSSYVPPPSLGGIPLHMPPTVRSPYTFVFFHYMTFTAAWYLNMHFISAGKKFLVPAWEFAIWTCTCHCLCDFRCRTCTHKKTLRC
jgi:hypothetical protein